MMKEIGNLPRFRKDWGGGSLVLSYRLAADDFVPILSLSVCYPTVHVWWKKQVREDVVTGIKLSARTKFVVRYTKDESFVVTVRLLGFGFSFTYQWGY